MFVSTTKRSRLRALPELSILAFVFFAFAVFALGSILVRAQKVVRPGPAVGQTDSTTSGSDEPLLREYKGVGLGMTAEEARGKLGDPADKSDQQDFYNVSDNESAQIFYDASRKVMAVSVHYVGGAPTPKSILGAEAQPGPDGSIFRLVRYPRAGYWVSYHRTAGDAPLVTVTMRKAE